MKTRLTTGDADRPIWSPDGTQIAFARTELGGSQPRGRAAIPPAHVLLQSADGTGEPEVLYVRYSNVADGIDPGYPKWINRNWMPFPT